MKAIKVNPGKSPEIVDSDFSLASLQSAVDGYIEILFPYDDDVCIICNEEGKINGMELNRALFDDDGKLYDVIAGPFLIAGCTDDSFCGLDDARIAKYSEIYARPETYAHINGQIVRTEDSEKKMLYSAFKIDGWNALIGYAASEKKPFVIIMNKMIVCSYKTMPGASRALKAMADAFGAPECSYRYISEARLVSSEVILPVIDMRPAVVRELNVKVF